MQFQVPQGLDLEDKIIGPLTLIQFLYLLIGGIIDYLLFFAIFGSFLFWLIAIPVALVALALAFLKIQDQPLSYFIKSGFIYLGRPKIRLWHRQGYAKPSIQKTIKKIAKNAPPPKKAIEKSELEKLAYVLDVGGVKPNKK